MNPQAIVITERSVELEGFLGIPDHARGLIIFAHGSGSGRFSPRNNYVAQSLRDAGFATLVLDLLTVDEERRRPNVFDIAMLSERMGVAIQWARKQPHLRDLPIGLFGASTGAAAALLAAGDAPTSVAAVVSRGGRPDLAGAGLHRVSAPTLLIVGSRDGPVIEMNEQAFEKLDCQKALVIVPGAAHLFEEPGKLDEVVGHAIRWFDAYLKMHEDAPK